MANLFPVDYEEEIITEDEAETDEPVGYRPGPLFTEDLVRDGQHRFLEATGIESWKIWCRKCLMTERYSHACYSTDFGISAEAAMGAESHQVAESILVREINEALLADPYGRTQYVENIRFEWTAPDAVLAEVSIVGIEEVTIDITVTLGG